MATQSPSAGPSTTQGMAYDPEQDPEERRRVRRDYRDLAKETENANPAEYSAVEMSRRLNRANDLFGQVKGTQEATLDSAFLVMASNMSALKARSMKTTAGAFDVEDFIEKLISFMGGNQATGEPAEEGVEIDDTTPLKWDKIGRKALAKSRRVPVMDFMLGPLSIEQKKRAQSKRTKLEKDVNDERKPQEITEDDIQRSENETTKNVANIQRILEHTGEVNLFKFIINPGDFAQSVENLFYLSFLIRDGSCSLEVEKGEPIIFFCGEAYAKGVR